MAKNLFRAIRLEFNFIKQSRSTLILSFILPIIFAYFFGLAGQINSWKPNVTYFTLYASSVLPLFVLFLATQLTIMRIVGERAPYGTLDRDLLSLSRTSIFFGKFIVNSVIAIIQSLIVFFISYGIFHLSVQPVLFLFILIFISLFGVALGLLLSTISSNKEQASQIVPFVVLTLFIFNGTIIGFDGMSSPIKDIISNFPLAIATDSINRMVNFNQGFSELGDNIFMLFISMFITILIGWVKFYSEHFKK